MWSFVAQTLIVTKKTLLTLARRKGSTLAYLSSPVLVCLLLVMLQFMNDVITNQQLPHGGPLLAVDRVPRCHQHGDIACKSIVYSPNKPWVASLMSRIAVDNALEFGVDVVPLPNGTNSIVSDNTTWTNLFVEHPNATQLAVVFQTAYFLPWHSNDTLPPTVGYTIFANGTDKKLQSLALPLERSLQQEMLSMRAGRAINITVEWKTFPRAPLRVEGYDVVAANGAQWFFVPATICFMLLLNEIAIEKERKLRLGMETMGLRASVYWLVWLMTAVGLSLLVTLILMAAGFACRFNFFTNSSFAAVFLLFFLFAMSLCSMAFLVSTLVSRSATAQTIGYGVILIGFIFQAILGSAYGLLVDFLFSDVATTLTIVVRRILMIYPPFNMSMAFSDIAALSSAEVSVAQGAVVQGVGFAWSDLFRERTLPKIAGLVITLPAPIDSLYMLIYNFIGMLVLALYIDHCFPGDGAGGAHPLFFIRTPLLALVRCVRKSPPSSSSSSPSSSGPASIVANVDETRRDDDDDDDDNDNDEKRTLIVNSRRGTINDVNSDDAVKNVADDDGDDDASVREERALAMRRFAESNVEGVFVRNLAKTYGAACSRNRVAALRDVSLAFERGEITCILGPNGAGKTTLLSLILGLSRSTGGDVCFLGHSSCDSVRSQVGVCPQHDILFDKLTAREHLHLFGKLKQVEGDLNAVVESMLDQVDLATVADHCVDTFSGGMKRRLSLAIAALGDPKVVVLDECTTGLDPVHRRDVWQIIERLKRDRVVILTTHSMEEADILADKVVMMVGGRARTVGSPLALKNRYGAGWTIDVDSASSDLCDELQRSAPSATISRLPTPPSSSSSSTTKVDPPVQLRLSRESSEELIQATSALEARGTAFVVRQSTLEDVFENVATASGFVYEEIEVPEEDVDGAPPVVSKVDLERGSPSPYRASLFKNAKLQWAQRGANCCQLTTPVLMIVTLVIIQVLLVYQLGPDVNSNVLLPAVIWPLNTPIEALENFTHAFAPGVNISLPWLGVWKNDRACAQFLLFNDQTGGLAGHLAASNGTRDPPRSYHPRSSKSTTTSSNVPALNTTTMMTAMANTTTTTTTTMLTTTPATMSSTAANITFQGLLNSIQQYSCMAPQLYSTPMPPSCGANPFWSAVNNHINVPFFVPLASDDDMDSCVFDVTRDYNNASIHDLNDRSLLVNYEMPDGMVSFREITNSSLHFWLSVNDHPIIPYHRPNNFTRVQVDRDEVKHRNDSVSTAFALALAGHPLIDNFARLATLNMIGDAFAKQILGKDAPPDMILSTKFAARMPGIQNWNIVQLLRAFGSILFPIALSLQLPVSLYVLVLERNIGIRDHMAVHGLQRAPYWISAFVFNFALFALGMLLLTIAGIWAEIEFFSQTAWWILIVFYAGWGVALVTLAFFVSTFVASPRLASFVGYALALLGALIGIVVCAGIYSEIALIGNGLPLPWYYLLYPQWAMIRACYLINLACVGYHECLTTIPMSFDSEMFRVMLAIYCDAILYGVLGVASETLMARFAAWRVQRAPSDVSRHVRALNTLAIDDNDNDDDDDAKLSLNSAIDSEMSSAIQMPIKANVGGVDAERANLALDVGPLWKKYDGAKRCAVRNVAFTIERGSVLALCGANGAGKSTLLSMLIGAALPTRGDAFVGGASVVNDLAAVRRQIGVCTQFDVLWPDLSVRDTMMFFVRLKGVRRAFEAAHVDRLLGELGLRAAQHRTPSQLSGGMRRRLSIGIALCGHATIAFLDEPSTGLDPVSRANIWRIIRRATRHGTSMLLTTHAFDEASALASRVAIMHQGQLRAIDTVPRLVRQAGRRYVLRVAHARGATLDAVLRAAPDALREKQFERSSTFIVDKFDASTGRGVKFSELFVAMRNCAEVSDFSLQDVGLTQVFESIVEGK